MHFIPLTVLQNTVSGTVTDADRTQTVGIYDEAIIYLVIQM